MIVRRAKGSDEEAIRHVIKTVYDEYDYPWEPDAYHRDLYDLERHHPIFFVAEHEDRVVGCCGLDLFETVPGEVDTVVEIGDYRRVAGTDCELVRLYVLPTARRIGVGRALTQAVIDAAKQKGRKRMELWTDKAFEAAHRLYQSFGAQVVGDRLCSDELECPEWGMVIRL